MIWIEGQWAIRFRAGELVEHFAAEALPPERLDEEFHPVPLLVLVVAQPMEHANDRFGDGEDAIRRQKLEEDESAPRHRRRASGDGDPEAARRQPAAVRDARLPT